MHKGVYEKMWLVFLMFLALQCYFTGGIFYFLIGAIRESRLNRSIKSRGVYMEGRITGARLKRNFPKPRCLASYSYEVEGKTYYSEQQIDNDDMLGVLRPVSAGVYYLPDNPRRSRLVQGRNTVGRQVAICMLFFVDSLILSPLTIGIFISINGH